MMVLPFLALYLTDEMDWTLGMASIAGLSFGAGGLVSSIIGGWLIDRYPTFKIMLWSLIVGGICFVCLTWIRGFYPFVIGIFITTTISDILRPAAISAVTQYSTKQNLARGISLLRLAINLGIAVGPAIGGLLIASLGYQYIFIVDGLTCVAAGFLVLYLFRRNLNNMAENKSTSNPVESKSAYLDHKFIIFLILNLVMLSMFFQILHSIPVFFRDVYHLTEPEIGLFFMMNGLFIFFIEMPIIFAFEKRNLSYKPLILGTVLIALSFIFLQVDFGNVWISIILFNLIISIGEVISFPFISTISILRAGDGNKGSYIGIMGTSFSLAFMLAPLFFLPFVDNLGYNNIWTICIVVCLLMAVGLIILKPHFEEDINKN